MGGCERQECERLGGSGGTCIFPQEILKNEVVEVHISCILRVILTFTPRQSRPLQHVRKADVPIAPPSKNSKSSVSFINAALNCKNLRISESSHFQFFPYN